MSLFENRHLRNGYTYAIYCKMKADESEDDDECIYYLTESHMPTLRTVALKFYEVRRTQDQSHAYKIDRSVFDPNCEPKYCSDNWAKIKHFYSSLPKEWSVVQLTEGYNCRSHFNVFNDKSEEIPVSFTLTVYVVINCSNKT